ncbi:hypothetical protein BJX64DRAFT_271922 [Aspergillus heterothallicus]
MAAAMHAMRIACEPCRLGKRRCDRAVPACGRCARQSRSCYYELTRLSNGRLIALAKTSNQPLPGLPQACPVSFRGYMPRLITHYYESFESPLVASSDSTAYKMRSTWFQYALSDPCLFHVTLYIGSSYFDIKSGNTSSTITLYHQTEIIRHIKKRLSDPVEGVDDSTIASVALLALFSGLGGNRATSQIHAAGLRRLTRLRGGYSTLGLDGLLVTLIHTAQALQTIVFDVRSGLLPQGHHAIPPLGLESRILQYRAVPFQVLDAFWPSTISSASNHPDVSALFSEIYKFKIEICRRGTSLRTAQPLKSHYHELAETSPVLQSNDPVYRCCALATSIFWLMMDAHFHLQNPARFSSSLTVNTKATLPELAQQLKDALSLVDDTAWLQSNPVAYCWVCLLGAAVTRDTNLRAWFWIRQARIMMFLDSVGDVGFVNDLLMHVVWLRGVSVGL